MFSARSFNEFGNNLTIFGYLVSIIGNLREYLSIFLYQIIFVCLFGEIHLSKISKRIFMGTYKHHTDSV